MNIIVKMSTYATRKCGTAKDCPNLQLTSQGWVAKFGTIKTTKRMYAQCGTFVQPSVRFNISQAEYVCSVNMLGNWDIDTLCFKSDLKPPFSTKSLEVDTIDF